MIHNFIIWSRYSEMDHITSNFLKNFTNFTWFILEYLDQFAGLFLRKLTAASDSETNSEHFQTNEMERFPKIAGKLKAGSVYRNALKISDKHPLNIVTAISIIQV